MISKTKSDTLIVPIYCMELRKGWETAVFPGLLMFFIHGIVLCIFHITLRGHVLPALEGWMEGWNRGIFAIPSEGAD